MTRPDSSALSLSFNNNNAWQQLRSAVVARRIQLGLSQKELAQIMGISQSAVSQFESLGGNPRLMTLMAYAQALNLELGFSVKNLDS